MQARQDQKQARETHFDRHGVLAPLLFLISFVLFVYGGMLIAMLGVSAWAIDSHDLSLFAQLETLGIWLLAFCTVAVWLSGCFVVANIAYYILRLKRRYILAENVRLYMIIILVGIFIVPFILWRHVRNNHPGLRHRYRQKLKRLARTQKMQERLSERRLRNS